jgi:hypothetical protein
MNYTLNDIWEQSKSNSKSVCLSHNGEEAYMYKGVKIIKFDGLIKIYNTSNSQLKYTEMNESEYVLFRELGFLKAIVEVLKASYQKRIDELNYRIKYEVNTRNNKKHYDSLKLRRENLINKYSNISKL